MRTTTRLFYRGMNRPRNKQPRAPRGQDRAGRGDSSNHQNRPRPEYKPVPSIQQVQQGKSVSIVLKQDQPTGREVQGIVQELLTRGDHPRGIKVKLTDGRVGRVQRMADGSSNESTAVNGVTRSAPVKHIRDARLDEFPEGPPPRTLADYLPEDSDEHGINQSHDLGAYFKFTATVKCPVCGAFEGDEVAVARHVDDHFT